jgi:glycerophosphoryl diester phosphodiesterase
LPEKDYIFELTLEENRSTEPTFELPTLKQVLDLTDRRTFLNIELKVPKATELCTRYNL